MNVLRCWTRSAAWLAGVVVKRIREQSVFSDARAEARRITGVQRILESPKGQANLLEQYQRGCLPPPVLIMLFHYAFGPHKKTVELEGQQIETLRFVIEDHACRAAGIPDDDEPTGEGVAP